MPRTTIAGKVGNTECSPFIDLGADISIVRSDLVNDDQYLTRYSEGHECK